MDFQKIMINIFDAAKNYNNNNNNLDNYPNKDSYPELLAICSFSSYNLRLNEIMKMPKGEDDKDGVVALFASFKICNYYICKVNGKIYQVITSPDSTEIYNIILEKF